MEDLFQIRFALRTENPLAAHPASTLYSRGMQPNSAEDLFYVGRNL
jgi:hypothetical protein